MAEKYRKIDGRLMVLPTVQTRKVEIMKMESLFWFDDSQKPKDGTKVPYFAVGLRVGSQFCP